MEHPYTLKTGPFQIIGPYFGYDMRPLNQVWYQHQIIMAIKEDAQKNNITMDLPIGIIPNHEYFDFLNFRYFSMNHDLAYQFEAFWLPKEAESAQKDRLLMMDYLVTKTVD